MAEATGYVTQFPSQSVDDATKASEDYGMEVAMVYKTNGSEKILAQADLFRISVTFINCVYMLVVNNLFKNTKMNFR